MFCMVDRFSQISKAVILSFSLLAVFSGLCYGQQNNGQTTRLISGPVKFNSTNTTFTGGDLSSVSGDGTKVAYSANNFKRPAIFRNPNVINDQPTFISPSLGGPPEEGLKTSQNFKGDMIAFTSSTISGDGRNNVYLFNGQGTVTLISTALNSQTPANSDSDSPSISRDGKFIVFVSRASNITVDAPIDGTSNVYLFNGNTNSVSLVSKQASGQPFVNDCTSPAVSENGTTIVFASNGRLFLKSMLDSNPPTEIPATAGAALPTISADGKTIAYVSNQPEAGTVVVLTSTGTGTFSARTFPLRTSNKPALSGNGQFIAADSGKDLTVDDTNGFRDVYVFSTQSFTPTLVSVTDAGQNASGNSFAPSINDDGSVIAFSSNTTLTPESTTSIPNVYARLSSNGGLAGGGVGSLNTGPVCIGRGRALAPDTIEISWGFGAHNDQLKGYTVEVMKLQGKDYKSVAKVPADGKALYVDTGLTPSTVYTYRLVVSDPKGFAYTVDFSTKTKKVKKH